MRNDNSEPEILLREGRFFRRTINEVDLGAQDTVLATLVEQTNIMVPSLMTMDDKPVHALIAPRQLILIVELKYLPYTTWWLPDSSDINRLTPVYTSTIRGAIQIPDTWTIPETLGQCFFALQFAKNTRAPFNFTPHACHLFIYREKELYAPPYPNCFEHGQLCMGNEWETNRALTPDSIPINNLKIAYDSFHTTTMNSDLTCDGTNRLFRRTLDGWMAPDRPERTLRHCTPAFMQGFSL